MRRFQCETSVKPPASKAEALSNAIIKASFQLQRQDKNGMDITSYPCCIRAPCVLSCLRWWFVQWNIHIQKFVTWNEGSTLSFQKAKLRIVYRIILETFLPLDCSFFRDEHCNINKFSCFKLLKLQCVGDAKKFTFWRYTLKLIKYFD